MMMLVVSSSSLPLWLCLTGAAVGLPVFTSIKLNWGSTVGEEMTMTVAEVTVVEPELIARVMSWEAVEAAVYLVVSNWFTALTATDPFVKPALVRERVTTKEILALEVARERPGPERRRRLETSVTETMLMSSLVTERVSAVSWVKAESTPASAWTADRPEISVEASIWATRETMVGPGVGLRPVERAVGPLVGETDGATVGERVGLDEGFRVGTSEGEAEGFRLGTSEGEAEGFKVGVTLGEAVGRRVGVAEGAKVGARVYEQKGFSEEYRVFLAVSVIE
jgi:hypothetical protein